MTHHRENGLLWVRLWASGPGLLIKDVSRHPMLFSQRNGCTKGLRIGRWWIQWLRSAN